MSHKQQLPVLSLSLKKDLCSDIEQRGGIRAFHGSEGSREQKLSKFLDERPELYGYRGGLKRKKIRFLVHRWYQKDPNQYASLCKRLGVKQFNTCLFSNDPEEEFAAEETDSIAGSVEEVTPARKNSSP